MKMRNARTNGAKKAIYRKIVADHESWLDRFMSSFEKARNYAGKFLARYKKEQEGLNVRPKGEAA